MKTINPNINWTPPKLAEQTAPISGKTPEQLIEDVHARIRYKNSYVQKGYKYTGVAPKTSHVK